MCRLVDRAGSTNAGSKPMRLRYLFLFATAFGVTYLVLFTSDTALKSNDIFLPWKEPQHKINLSFTDERFTIQTNGCSIPSLKPFDDAVKTFVKYPNNYEACPNATLSLLANNLTHIWVKEENKEYHNITEKDNFTCCYQSFFRPKTIDDITSSRNDDRVKYNKCKQFNNIVKANDEFVRVVCTVNESFIYRQYFLFFQEKLPSQELLNTPNNNSSAYNVVLMGIDAVSRLNFHRTMPKTLAYLKKNGAIEMLGYNKVGDNTFPNVIPMLLGISEQELKTTCIPHKKSTFDNCPFIWEWFKEKGYQTAFGEDCSSLGTFNYLRSGFLRSPVDYYIHTFINEAENNVGGNKDFNSFLCMNDKYFYEVLLDYVQSLLRTLRLSKVFGFFWEVTMSHDYLNYPMLIDNKYESFLKNLDEARVFDNTVFILVSDHGIRWGDIRSTKQGRLEERLPFVYILLPQSFREKYDEAYSNIVLNSRRLTTPYDLHATLVDLIDTKNIENEVIDTRKSQSYGQKREISLFLPIPTNRTCKMANIDDHWCTCFRSRSLTIDNPVANEVAVQLEGVLNMLISSYSQCARLKLSEILEVNELDVGSTEEDEVGWREYMVVIRTSPGGGLFEATLRHDKQQWTLKGTVSRLNLYGDQSRCMHNYQLKLYCFCQ